MNTQTHKNTHTQTHIHTNTQKYTNIMAGVPIKYSIGVIRYYMYPECQGYVKDKKCTNPVKEWPYMFCTHHVEEYTTQQQIVVAEYKEKKALKTKYMLQLLQDAREGRTHQMPKSVATMLRAKEAAMAQKGVNDLTIDDLETLLRKKKQSAEKE